MNTSKLESGRFIPAGDNCPFSEVCPAAKLCNRPKNMALVFSCDQARIFDRLQMGGGLAQAMTVDGLYYAPAVSRNDKGIRSLLQMEDEEYGDEPESKATGGYHTGPRSKPSSGRSTS